MTRRFIGRRTASLLVLVPLALLLYSGSRWWDTTAIALPTPPRSENVHLAATAARPVFTHAVIPGGAYSAQELRDAFQRDAVVAAHYRDVDPRDVRLTTLSKGKAAYVSYRVGDRIYWTRNRVWIAPGESVLTDGTVQIRARCGNCISDTQGEVAAVEPASGVLDDSVIPPTDDSQVEAFAAEAEPGLGELLAIPFAPQAFTSFTPQASAFTSGVTGTAPFVPGGGNTTGSVTSSGSTSGSTGGQTGGATSGSSGGATTGSTGGTTSTGSTGGTTSGSSGSATTGSAGTTTTGTSSGTPTTGTTGGVTTGASSSTTTGSPTTGFPTTGDTTGGVVTTNGSPTSGVSESTSTGQHEAPEPDVLWLVALGALGLANRAWRRRR